MPNGDQIYPTKELNLLSSENPENKFFALDLKQSLEATKQVIKNKRKFVCVELLNDKLQAKNSSHKEVETILETDKNKIIAAFYVKGDEKEKLANEITEKLKK